jgi:carbon-monoxide dehydrogenase catalytic subunit
MYRAPKRQDIWRKLKIVPRGVDREVVESMHRTHVGVDQDADHLLDQGMRTSLADGWGGAMLATDLSDVLFGTPKPIVSQANLGVLKEEDVNIIVHGHEPTLSEMIVAAAQDPEVIDTPGKGRASPLPAYAAPPTKCSSGMESPQVTSAPGQRS